MAYKLIDATSPLAGVNAPHLVALVRWNGGRLKHADPRGPANPSCLAAGCPSLRGVG
jgi:hypothetical protein